VTEGAAPLGGDGSFLDRVAVGEDEVAIVPLYSKRQVVEAGKFLAQDIPESRKEEAIEAFKIAHNWRDAHVRPLVMMRAELVGRLKVLKFAHPTAARLKRMKSIRSKLAKGRLTLYQMQDVGGYRVILPSLAELEIITKSYQDGCKHELMGIDDYVDNPKRDGYRCRHLIFKFRGRGPDEVFNRQRLEMQVRSQLQHAWATAVEAVGLYRSEDLKGGAGNEDWRRFFQLVSSEFADEEGTALVPDTPSKKDRKKELKHLNKKLGAVSILKTFNQAVQYSEDFFVKDAEFFLIQYDRKTQSVVISPYNKYGPVSNAYIHVESSEEDAGLGKTNVLVEVDAIEDLKAAYPNYFLDVALFLDKLAEILG
jgi:ppGpp synthetase/RelA/SpoT-type nucleotidyltranferase